MVKEQRITVESLRKYLKKRTDSQLRSTYAALHSKTGVKGAKKVLDIIGSSLTVSKTKSMVKAELDRRKKEKIDARRRK